MQTCSTCNYESPGSAKFCRQCGAPLFAESDLSGASTRNYGRQEPAPAVAAAVSAPLPPSVADIIGANTARHYQPPQAFVQPVVNTAPITGSSSKFRSWRLFLFIMAVLFIGVAMGRLFLPGNHREQIVSPEELARLDAHAQMQIQQQHMADLIREAQNRTREEQSRLREAQRQALELAQRAAEAGAPVAASDGKPLNLDQYEYPGAAVGNYSRIPGSEMLQARTRDSFNAIKEYYQGKLGKPLLYINNEDDDKSLFFQSNTSPVVFVSVEHDDDSDRWLITITRAPFQFPQPDAPKVASGGTKQ